MKSKHTPLHDQLLGKEAAKKKLEITRNRERSANRVNYSREYQRQFVYACRKVVDRCNDIRSVLGQVEAFDYSRLKDSGEGAQYAPHGGFPFLEFTVDVLNVARNVLSPQEFAFFTRHMYDNHDLDYTRCTDDEMRLQEKLGRAFMGRGLYPVSAYFRVIKRGKE